VPPVATGGTKAMDQDQRRCAPLSDDAPMAGVALPVPGPVLTPVHPRRGRLEIQSRWRSHSGRHG
jgi:hypothetical protein